jgi:hypothetical protein
MARSTSDYYKANPKARKKRVKQQARYNKTKKGKKLIKCASKLRDKLKIPKGSKMDASHYKGGGCTNGRAEHRKANRTRPRKK